MTGPASHQHHMEEPGLESSLFCSEAALSSHTKDTELLDGGAGFLDWREMGV